MKRIKQMLRNLPIKDKLTKVFQLVTVAYVLLAAVALFQTLRSANYIGAVIILIIAISGVIFNYSVIKSLADMLVDPIQKLTMNSANSLTALKQPLVY